MDPNKRSRFGLIGRNISYSFSKGYFEKKFLELGLNQCSYENFDLQSIDQFPEAVLTQKEVMGLNVTIPYKQDIIPYLDEMDSEAALIGAVNTIKVSQGKTKGYNTDAFGFKTALTPFLKTHHQKALLLGTGGASKAVLHTLKQCGIETTYVSRNPIENQFSYDQLDEAIIKEHTLIVNCSPVGTFPNVLDKPQLPYEHIGKDHLLFDLIYNPEKTAFLKAAEAQGAQICNGYQMLVHQAEKAWEIWNRPF